jgi:hypothetical protein
MIGVWSPAGAEDFSSSLCVQTGCRAHPAFYPVGTGGKALPAHDTVQSPPFNAEVKMSRSYTSSPPEALHDMYGYGFALLFILHGPVLNIIETSDIHAPQMKWSPVRFCVTNSCLTYFPFVSIVLFIYREQQAVKLAQLQAKLMKEKQAKEKVSVVHYVSYVTL